MSTSRQEEEQVMEQGQEQEQQEQQEQEQRTYAHATRKRRRTPTTNPQEHRSRETHAANAIPPAPQNDEDDAPFKICTRAHLWTTTDDLHQTRLNKTTSAVVHFPRYSNVDSLDLIEALEEAGFTLHHVKAVQRCPQPDVFNVTFYTPELREHFISIRRLLNSLTQL